jgi:P27 family predicted phage terminase small subunit
MSVHPLPHRGLRAPSLPAAPRHLRSREARRLWRSTVKDFALEAHQLALLESACKSLDRLVEAREQIDRDGITVKDRFGQLREHPATKIERDSRIALARLLRELQLTDEADLDNQIRPPRAR